MALANEILALRDRTLTKLIAAHDYFEDTKFAWSIVCNSIQAGGKFSNRNATTGTITTQAELLAKANEYVAVQLSEATFQQFFSIFENYFFDPLRLWLLSYPRNLIGKKIDIKTVLDSPDKDAILLFAVNKELNEVLYERPADWFAYLDERAKLGCPTPDEIDRIAEAKASRDVLVHSQGVVGKSYLSKAGKLARFNGAELLEIPEWYHRHTWELLCKVVVEVSTAAAAKAS